MNCHVSTRGITKRNKSKTTKIRTAFTLKRGCYTVRARPAAIGFAVMQMEQKLFTELRPLYVTSKDSPYEIRLPWAE